jgi:methylglutamate dehydrogenase subunit D
VSEFRLAEQAVFEKSRRLAEAWDGFAMEELARAPTFWLASNSDSEAGLAKACDKLFGCDLPTAGRFAAGKSDRNEIVLAWVGNRQWLLRGATPDAGKRLERTAYLTDQSDGWVGLSVSGEKARDVLATLCPLDLDEKTFPTGSSARAPFEGLHCIILCRDAGESRFELFFQRSSAGSFAENLRHGAYSYCGARIVSDD